MAGIKLSSTQELPTVISQIYDLPLRNFSSTAEVEEILKTSYFAVDTAFWVNAAKNSGRCEFPCCWVVTTDGVGAPGFTIDEDYTSETNEYEIKNIYKDLNLKYTSRTIADYDSYTGACDIDQKFVHGVCTLGWSVGFQPSHDNWYFHNQNWADAATANGGLYFAGDLDTNDSDSDFSFVGAFSRSYREHQKDTWRNYTQIGTKQETFSFIINNENVKVPLIDSDFNATIFAQGRYSLNFPKKMADVWQNTSVSQMGRVNPEYKTYHAVKTSYCRSWIPTFLTASRNTFNKLDTMQKCAKLYKNAIIGTDNVKIYPISGVLLCRLSKDPIDISFEFDFKQTAGNGKYHLLFKKGNGFSATEITNKTSLPYYIENSSTPASAIDYIDHGTVKITLKDIEQNDKLWMTWITNDSNDGGTLNSLVSATMTVDN